MSHEHLVQRFLGREAKKVKPKRDFAPLVEEETYLSRAGRKLIELAERFGENLAQEVDHDKLLELIKETTNREKPIVLKALRGLGFDVGDKIKGLVWGSLLREASPAKGVPKHIYNPLKKLVEEGKTFDEASKNISEQFKGFKLKEEDYAEMKEKIKTSFIASELNKIAEELEKM